MALQLINKYTLLRPGIFRFDGFAYKCESCGVCSQEYEMLLFSRLNHGIWYEWMQCPRCRKKGNILITNYHINN